MTCNAKASNKMGVKMFDQNYKFTCIDRFLKYVKYDTQSDEESTTFPSDPKQLELSKDLVVELKKLVWKMHTWMRTVMLLQHYQAIQKKDVPVMGFIAHVDTSPAVSGKNVNPQIVINYQGGDIILQNGKVIVAEENPELTDMTGF